MALTGAMTTESGIAVLNSYLRVSGVVLDYAQKCAYISVMAHRDKDARVTGLPAFWSKDAAVYATEFEELFGVEILNQQGVNAISQSYEHLKRLEEFSDKQDV